MYLSKFDLNPSIGSGYTSYFWVGYLWSIGTGILKMRLRSFVCVEVLRPSQPNGVMLSAVSLPNHTFTGQA